MTTERDVLRELEAALDVSPSQDFEARVRERVRTTSIGVPAWTWTAGIAVAATVVLAVMLVPTRESSTPRPHGQPEARAGVSIEPSPAATTAVTPIAGDPRTPPRRQEERRSRSGVSTTAQAPEVVVPAGQMAGIRRLMAEVAAGRLTMAPPRPEPPAVIQVSALDEAPPITFDVIDITPVSTDSSSELWR